MGCVGVEVEVEIDILFAEREEERWRLEFRSVVVSVAKLVA